LLKTILPSIGYYGVNFCILIIFLQKQGQLQKDQYDASNSFI